ncbi:MAG TPA: rubrerythrin family protein [Lachnospiraceae bacterium]|nr:rubrerythrin family protein [Lachnospiraceae bacterium]
MNFKQSKTYANLEKAYESELISSTRYHLYADKAQQDRYIEISNIFMDTSDIEKAHAAIWLRKLNMGLLPTTLENLESAVYYESYAGNQMYRDFAKVAKEEGYLELEALFNGVANIEINHELVFQILLENVKNDQVFCKEKEVLWICINCGNIMRGVCAPEICPVCLFPQGYYKLFENF